MPGLDALVLYMLLTAAMYYLGARATITSWLWSRYPRKLAVFMDCPSCTGFWYGIVVAAVFRRQTISLPGDLWWTPIAVGLCSMVWTPCVAALMHVCFMRLGDATPDVATPGAPGPIGPTTAQWTELP